MLVNGKCDNGWIMLTTSKPMDQSKNRTFCTVEVIQQQIPNTDYEVLMPPIKREPNFSQVSRLTTFNKKYVVEKETKQYQTNTIEQIWDVGNSASNSPLQQTDGLK